jgi:hypothetical protein
MHRGERFQKHKAHTNFESRQASYTDDFAPEKEALRAENTYFWNIYPNISMQ